MIINESDIELISSKLQDDISRTIFSNRIMFSLTSDVGYLRNICYTIPETIEFTNWLDKNTDRELILFGAGQWGKWILETFNNYPWKYFADNNANSHYINEIKVINIEELKRNHDNSAIVITSKYHWESIHNQLIENGVAESNIYDFGRIINLIESRIYFDLPYLKKEEKEIFADVGGYDGNTTLEFSKWSNSNYSIKIFEPNIESQNECFEKLKNLDNVEIIPKGAWSKETVLSFQADGSGSKIIDSNADAIKVPVTILDEELRDGVTFIKMDIEGSELEALKGSKYII